MTTPQAGGPRVADYAGSTIVTGVRAFMRDDFNLVGAGAAAIDATKWDVSIAAGMTVSATGSTLSIAAGTTANQSTTLTSKQTFRAPFRTIVGFRQSIAKQANQAFRIALVALNADGSLDENNRVQLETTIGSATANAYQMTTVSDGNALAASSTGSTYNTTDCYFELNFDCDQIIAAGGTLNSAARAFTYPRDHFLPDPERQYKLRLSVVNDVGFAGSANTYSLFSATTLDLTEVQAEISGGRGTGGNVQVVLAGTPGMVPVVSNTTAGSSTFTRRISTADTNAALIAAAATSVCFIHAANTSATWRWLKLFNKATAPVPGTDTPSVTIGIPPNGIVEFDPVHYVRLGTGLGIAITGGMADLDATAIGAGEVLVTIGRI